MKRPDLHRLSTPFPAKFVAKKEGADYVNHAIVQQRLLGTVGPFDMRVDEIIRGPIAEKVTGQGDRQRTWPAADNAVVGVVLTCTFTIDGERVAVSEVGTPEGYYMAAHDGERLKKAMSDALKRCAMRIGVGLDLWSKGAYVLPAMLAKDLDPETGEVEAPAPDHDAPDPDDTSEQDMDAREADLSPAQTVGDKIRVAAKTHGLIPQVKQYLLVQHDTDKVDTLSDDDQQTLLGMLSSDAGRDELQAAFTPEAAA